MVSTKEDAKKLDFSEKIGKISLLFEARDIPASLYKCLGAFATLGINMTKIESLPSYHTPFYRIFWLDIESKKDSKKLELALDELSYFAKDIRILGQY